MLARVLGAWRPGRTTFDLAVLLALAVALLGTAVRPGPGHAGVFVVTVAVTHWLVMRACERSDRLRRLLSGV